MKYLAILAALYATGVQAIDFGKVDAVGLHTISYHDPQGGANNLNPGVYAHTDKGYVVGTYYNSWQKPSVYAGWQTPEWYRTSLAFVAVTGYTQPVTFIAIPSVRLYTNNAGMSVSLSGSPTKITQDGQMVVHLSFSWPIK